MRDTPQSETPRASESASPQSSSTRSRRAVFGSSIALMCGGVFVLIHAWFLTFRGPHSEKLYRLAELPSTKAVESLLRAHEFYAIPWIYAGLLALGLAACTLTAKRIQAPTIQSEIKITHLLPAFLQLVILSYWLAHWSDGRTLVALIAIQLAYAYLLEFYLSILADRPWRLGFGPLPIVLSTNLFAQYMGGAFWCGLLAVTTAIVSKAFIHRDGAHVFNPSVVGLTVIGIIDLASGAVPTPDFAHEFHSAPNMTEVILILALVVQVRIPIVLVTLGATFGIFLTNTVVPDAAFLPTWAAVTLVLCLLITDPATIPKRPLAKIVFGLFIGAGMVLGHNILLTFGHSDFWAKVIPIPLANVLVPTFDRVAGKFPDYRLLRSNYGLVHVALWAMISTSLVSKHKALIFEGARREAYTSACYVDSSDPTRCANNPAFCRPFGFVAELQCWRAIRDSRR